ncbi:hypothetical protein BJ741DRAFT_612214 [Chytriomyces cf. hyalinus JEL632]|nr:hypothetical protein BJ741DRAFT_612214 [Chytriomyces cf. hyalinus JEL632]
MGCGTSKVSNSHALPAPQLVKSKALIHGGISIADILGLVDTIGRNLFVGKTWQETIALLSVASLQIREEAQWCIDDALSNSFLETVDALVPHFTNKTRLDLDLDETHVWMDILCEHPLPHCAQDSMKHEKRVSEIGKVVLVVSYPIFCADPNRLHQLWKLYGTLTSSALIQVSMSHDSRSALLAKLKENAASVFYELSEAVQCQSLGDESVKRVAEARLGSDWRLQLSETLLRTLASLWIDAMLNEQIISVGDDDEAVLKWKLVFAAFQEASGRLDCAVDTLLQCLTLASRIYQHEAPYEAIIILQHLTRIWTTQARYERVVPLWEHWLEHHQAPTPLNQTILDSMLALAGLYLKSGSTTSAVAILVSSLQQARSRLEYNEGNVFMLKAMTQLARVHMHASAYEMAVPLLQRVYVVHKERGAYDVAVACDLARVCAALRDYGTAKKVYSEVMQATGEKEGYTSLYGKIQHILALIDQIEDGPLGLSQHKAMMDDLSSTLDWPDVDGDIVRLKST